jgi:ssDNA-binding Zn-finger/Zn-ribbon topoisomerase 1
MDEKQKKVFVVALTIMCIGIAAFVLVSMTNTEDELSGFSGQQMWVICTNPNCKTHYQVDKEWFFREIQKTGSMFADTVGIQCKECQQSTTFEAVKCSSCGHVFKTGAAGRGDFPDRCPKCKTSEMEKSRQR